MLNENTQLNSSICLQQEGLEPVAVCLARRPSPNSSRVVDYSGPLNLPSARRHRALPSSGTQGQGQVCLVKIRNRRPSSASPPPLRPPRHCLEVEPTPLEQQPTPSAIPASVRIPSVSQTRQEPERYKDTTEDEGAITPPLHHFSCSLLIVKLFFQL